MTGTYFHPTPISDLLIYRPPIFRDDRGSFSVTFNWQHFLDQGLIAPFLQDNRSVSSQGTLRGLHLQTGEHAQAKLVGVLQGKVFDVAIDLRPGSPSFGAHYSIILDAQTDPQFLYIPRGFAHGFLVLSERAEFFYKVDNFYNPGSEGGIHYNDSDLNISWPEVSTELTLSEKDKILPSFNDFEASLGESKK